MQHLLLPKSDKGGFLDHICEFADVRAISDHAAVPDVLQVEQLAVVVALVT